MSKRIWHINNCSLFKLLDADQLRLLENNSRIREFPKNSTIYLPQDNPDVAYLVGMGRVRVCSNTVDGKQSILAFVEPGEIFGELAVIQNQVHEDRAEAANNSTIILIPRENILRLMESSPALSLGITKLISFRRKRIERRLRYLLFHSNYDRLANLLIELTEQYGKQTSDGIMLEIRLSHMELASIIGATRETITNLLGEMQSLGLLKISRQKIIVKDIRRLSSVANVTTPVLPTYTGGISIQQADIR